VPPLRLERHLFLDRRYNAFFSKGDAQLFLARRGDRVVGRISAQFDNLFNAHHGRRWGMFGFLELEDDPEILPALLAAGEEWLRARGCDRMVGPMDFSMNDESGVLIDGFERPPLIKMPWHPPYYRQRCEEAGLSKAMDLFMWELVISDRAKMLPVIFKLADELQPRHGIELRHMTRARCGGDMDRFAEVYNAAWSENWDFTPYTKKTLGFLAGELQLVFDPDWMMVAETPERRHGRGGDHDARHQPGAAQDERPPAAVRLVALPAPQQDHGPRPVGFLGVKPSYQHTGVAAKLYVEHFDRSAATRVKWGEMGWILETISNNEPRHEGKGGRIVAPLRMSMCVVWHCLR
jgi:hypothetical protein